MDLGSAVIIHEFFDLMEIHVPLKIYLDLEFKIFLFYILLIIHGTIVLLKDAFAKKFLSRLILERLCAISDFMVLDMMWT